MSGRSFIFHNAKNEALIPELISGLSYKMPLLIEKKLKLIKREVHPEQKIKFLGLNVYRDIES